MRSLDRPERAEATPAADLRARLDALPPNHPSSPGFPGRRTAAEAIRYGQPRGWTETAGGEKREPDQRGDGLVDERARVFQPAERAIADALAGRGALVTALAEDHSLRCRQPDALVDGRVTEFKSVRAGATDATIKNQLLAARGQAPNVVVDARGSGLGEDGAALGLRRFLGSPWGRDHYETILILGDSYAIGTARREEPADDPA